MTLPTMLVQCVGVQRMEGIEQLPVRSFSKFEPLMASDP